MKCPKCNNLLELNEAEGHIGFTCSKCKGIWLAISYLESLKHTRDFDLSAFRSILTSQKVNSPQTLSCPSCSNVLSTSQKNTIELDWCEKCGGTWFDQRELLAVAPYKYGQSNFNTGEPVGLTITIIDQFIAAYLARFPEPPPISKPDQNGYIPNHIPIKDRLRNSTFSALLFTYGTFGLYINDIFIPAKRGGLHLHNLAAGAMYGAIICACLVMIFVIIDHHDKRNNEQSYRAFARYTQYLGWFFFVASFILLIAKK